MKAVTPRGWPIFSAAHSLYRRQTSGDLGRRMATAFAEAFRSGALRVAVIGTDCPAITPELLAEAFQRLETADLVLGPATDGGYYLIALRRPVPELFVDIPWGSPRVLEQTLQRAQRLSLSVALLKTLSDVDRPEDVVHWERVGRANRAGQVSRISVIIPTFNEASYLPETLRNLSSAQNTEVIVVDAGSTDGTCQIVQQSGCQLLGATRRRASQMNVGARAATGAILLFLHADTCLPPGFDTPVRQALSRPRTVAGAFRLRIVGPGISLRVIQWGVNLRSQLLQMPYGDQALFVSTDTYRTVDYNVYWCEADPQRGTRHLREQLRFGMETHSLAVDPLLVDAKRGVATACDPSHPR